MFFNEFEKYKNAKFNTKLLWEFDVDDNFDWQKMSHTVVARTIELGRMEDYYAIIKIYGGIDNVKHIIKSLAFLNDKDMNFVHIIFDIDLEDLKCYTKKQSLTKPMLY